MLSVLLKAWHIVVVHISFWCWKVVLPFNLTVRKAPIPVRFQSSTKKVHVDCDLIDTDIFKNVEIVNISWKLSLISQTHTFYHLLVSTISSRTWFFPKRLMYVGFLLFDQASKWQDSLQCLSQTSTSYYSFCKESVDWWIYFKNVAWATSLHSILNQV